MTDSSGRSESEPRIKLGVFFSHPTQHHSVMFQSLSRCSEIDTRVYYYDPGQSGQSYDPGYGTKEAWDVDLLQGTNYTILKSLRSGGQFSAFRQWCPGVIPIMFRERFDAVLLFGYTSPTNRVVLRIAQRLGAHVLYQSDTNVLDVERKQPSRLKDWIRQSFLAKVDTFLAIGDKNRDAYLRFGCDPTKITWCPYPVDTRRYLAAVADPGGPAKLAEIRKRYEIPDNAHVVGFCGKLLERKRPRDVIEALRILNRPNVYGLLIGSGELETTLRGMLTDDDRIRITGFINQSMIPYHMRLADVGVVCSEADPHPLVTTEFAACGVPLLVSDRTGVWGPNDVLRDGENGFVYECGNVRQLASLLGRMFDDEPARQRMGARSLELSREQSAEHAAQAITDRLIGLGLKRKPPFHQPTPVGGLR